MHAWACTWHESRRELPSARCGAACRIWNSRVSRSSGSAAWRSTAREDCTSSTTRAQRPRLARARLVVVLGFVAWRRFGWRELMGELAESYRTLHVHTFDSALRSGQFLM